MSTLPPEPTYDPNVPVITNNSGNAAAEKNPSSPESIMKKTATLLAQSNVDSKYDVYIKDGFTNLTSRLNNIMILSLFLFALILLIFKLSKYSARLYLVNLSVLLLLVILVIYKNV